MFKNIVNIIEKINKKDFSFVDDIFNINDATLYRLNDETRNIKKIFDINYLSIQKTINKEISDLGCISFRTDNKIALHYYDGVIKNKQKIIDLSKNIIKYKYFYVENDFTIFHTNIKELKNKKITDNIEDDLEFYIKLKYF